MTDPTIFIVDDDASVRDSLALLLGLKGLRTQIFANAQTFLDTFREDLHGCVLLDVRMPGMTGLEMQAEMVRRGSDLPLIVMTAHGDVSTARAALKGGAYDFLEKPLDDEVLLDVLSSAIAQHAERRAIATPTEPARKSDLVEKLTRREREVMKLIADGLQNREVGQTLGISPRTVEVYKARMMEKLGARTIADIVRIALTGSARND